MVDFAGWLMPLRYTGDLVEHNAVRTQAGLFDLSHMAQIDISGPDAAAALDHALVTEVSRLRVGRARYTTVVNAQGGILDDLIVYRLGETEFLIIANAANRIVVFDALTLRSQGMDVAVEDRTAHRALIAVQGPKAVQILSELLPVDLSTVKYYSATTTSWGSVPILLARTGYTGEDGFELSLPADSAVAMWRALQESGGDDLISCGLAARDSLRLEAGMALYGQELTDQVTPFEAGLDRIVHLDHEFVGAEALRARAQDGPASYLVGLVGEGRRAARTGYEVRLDGSTIGTVTSGVLSPTLQYPIAMARVSEELPVGTDVGVDVRGTVLPMKVVELPFYRRNK